MIDPLLLPLAGGILGTLLVASVIGRLLARRGRNDSQVIVNLNQRIAAWWWLVLLVLPCVALGLAATTLLFAVASFFALREFISLTPTHRGDRLALFLAFFVAIPFQFALVGLRWYGLFAILLPVYGFFVFASASALTQDSDQFLERSARVQWAVMVCVYGVSHVPALLTLKIPGFDAHLALLLVFFLLIAQLSDVLQYVCGKLFGRHKLAPGLSPNKTWEGLIGGGLLASAVGAALHGFTPFSAWAAWGMSLAIIIPGFLGGLVLSAVKRSLDAKDWGYAIRGHGGVLDRIDSLAFSAPIFFHLTRYLYV